MPPLPAEVKAIQLSLFDFEMEVQNRLSWLVASYDLIPRFVFGKIKRSPEGNIEPVSNEFIHDGRRFRIVIKPVQVRAPRAGKGEKQQWKKGDWIHALPGKRERVIEDVLRRMACEGKTIQNAQDGGIGVKFTLFELFKELKELGHHYSYPEIRMALEILTEVTLKTFEVLGDGKEILLPEERLLEKIAGATEENWSGQGEKTAFIIFFNSHVKQSLLKATYRLVNFEKIMSYPREISVYLHKRMALKFVQAGFGKTYNILLSTIVCGCGLSKTTQKKYHNREVKLSLEELKNHKVLMDWTVDRTQGDYRYVLSPHPDFITEVKRANLVIKQNTRQIHKNVEIAC